MQALLIIVFFLFTFNLYACQSKNNAQTCMQILVSQMKMDEHNEAIGTILGPCTLQQESTRVNAYFKNVRLNFPYDVLKKIEKSFNEKDFSAGWGLVNAEMRQALALYYRESARVMACAQQRAITEDSGFANSKDCVLIKKMIASYDVTLKMLEISAKNENRHVETIELAILTGS